jgi:hypothetical protein
MELTINVSKKTWETTGRKFIDLPAGAKEGDVLVRKVELGAIDWDTPEQSIKFPVTIIEAGADEGKKDKLSCGVGENAVWKLKNICRNLSIPVKFVNNKVSINTDGTEGMEVYGTWIVQVGKNQTTGNEFLMPKLNDLTIEAPIIERIM